MAIWIRSAWHKVKLVGYDTAMTELVSDDGLVSTVFVKGAQVKLCDLSKRPELNGKCGTLTQALAEE